MRDLVCFDLETTSAEPAEARIVELAFVIRHGERRVNKRWLVNPGIPIPDEAREIHKITDAMVADAPSFKDLAPIMLATFVVGVPAGYNARSYDTVVLRHELARAGGISVDELDASMAEYGAPAPKPDDVLDPLVFVRWHLREQRNRKLEDVCGIFGLRTGTMHSALYDAVAAIGIIDAMTERGWIPEDNEAALALQRQHATIIDAEFDRWSWWIYADREDSVLRIGCGKHCGQRLDEVPPGYLRWCLERIPDLPPAVRQEFDRVADARALRHRYHSR